MQDERVAGPRPFRLTLKAAGPRDLDRLNAEQGRSRARAFEPAEDAMERARSARSAVADRILSWIEHPDERVAAAFLDNPARGSILRDGRLRGRMGRILLDRAVADARTEGVAWTPVLDALAARVLRPNRSSLLADAVAQLERMAPWLEGESAPADLAGLLSFEDESVARLMLTRARALTPELLQAALNAHPTLAVEVPENPYLTPRLVEAVCDWLSSPAARQCQQPRVSPFKVPGILEKAGWRLPRSFVEHVTHPPPDEDYWRIQATELHTLGEATYRALAAYFRQRLEERPEDGSAEYAIDALVMNPAVPDALVRELALDAIDRGSVQVPQFLLVPCLAHHEPVRARIRASALAGHLGDHVLLSLLETSPDASEADETFRVLVRTNAWFALQALEQPERSPHLGRRHLAPLLAHADRAIRERAFRLLVVFSDD